MTNHPNRRRIWQTSSGSVCLRDEYLGETRIREFWVLPGGGYVREIDERHPGTLGQQVCVNLSSRGPTLVSSPDSLIDLIRREYRRSQAAAKRERR